jgi:hypothetical protein
MFGTAGTGFPFALERRFQYEKAAPKLLNRACFASFLSQINALRRSDPVQLRDQSVAACFPQNYSQTAKQQK